MKRTISIIVITIMLLTLAVIELVNVNNLTHYMENNIKEITPLFEENKDDITILSNKIEQIADNWSRHEDALCLIFSHKDLSTTTDSLTKLLAYTKNNDYDNAIIELTLLNELTEKNYHIMGFNIHNVL